MTEIRPFRNSDLPGLLNVWIQHWSAIGPPPPVSNAMIEQAILARTFFEARHLLVVESEGVVRAWSHIVAERPDEQPEPDEDVRPTAVLAAICFDTNEGLASCDRLLEATEQHANESGFGILVTGPVRDDHCGYAGLAPLGHGVGIPNDDARTASLFSRRGYVPQQSMTSFSTTTNTYRPPVSRDAMQLRRSTRTDVAEVFPETPRRASSMAHLDIERHQLIEHRTGTVLAETELWISDPEAQVMDCSHAILSLPPGRTTSDGAAIAAESYLIGSLVQSLPNRRIFEIETVVDDNDAVRMEQLQTLKFEAQQRGQRWQKGIA